MAEGVRPRCMADQTSLFKSSLLAELWDRTLTPLDDPGSRLFYVNILASLLIAIGYFLFLPQRNGQRNERFRELWKNRLGLRRKYWWNRSAKTDYQLLILNSLLKVILFIPFLSFGFEVSQLTVRALLGFFGDFQGHQPSGVAIGLFTLAVFIWDDFLRFAHHVLMHRLKWLWPFHEAHHSARVLTPLTLFRTHPVEALLATLRNGLSLGVATGAFLFLFSGHFHVLTFFGVNLFGQLFNFFGANLRHSQVPIGFGYFERIFISPAQHQLHHSRATLDYDRNFGVSLAIWDQLFGTLVLSRDRKAQQQAGRIRFGVAGPYSGQIVQVLSGPFLKILSFKFQMPSNSLIRWARKRIPGQMPSKSKTVNGSF